MEPPRIYNLFPRLAGSMDRWGAHAERARAMGFDWIYLNPVSMPGFSGSLYAVREHDRVCPDFLPPGVVGDGMAELGETLAGFRSLGLKPAMDLVINHTAIDSPLVEEHPDWYLHDERGEVVRPSAIDPADARRVTVWGDLAEVDNATSPDRDGLWAYWRWLVRTYLEMGFEGFRCDAAYKVPAALWRALAEEARRVRPGAVFFAETLGCRIQEVEQLGHAGLDFLFNSSKYWNFDAPWALEQHAQFAALRPSVSFAESHDTPRLAAEVDGDLDVMRQRYLFSAVFSAGVMMPIGFEFAHTRKLDVVRTTPDDWEQTGTDLTAYVGEVNRLKVDWPLLGVEGCWRALTPYDRSTIVLEKSHGAERMLVLVNKDWHQARAVDLSGLPLPDRARLHRIDRDGAVHAGTHAARIELEPAEIALVR